MTAPRDPDTQAGGDRLQDHVRCACGRWMQRGLRYGPTPEPVPVLVCWDGCGQESPPLLRSIKTCDRGHPVAEYSRLNRYGWRYCLVCNADGEARRRAAS